MRAPVAGLALALLAACVPLPRGHVLDRRAVRAKEGEATLVSDDGARCKVDPATFARLEVGDEHRCVCTRDDAGRASEPGIPGGRVPVVPRPGGRPERSR